MDVTARGAVGQRLDRRRRMGTPAIAAGLLLIERELVAAMGTPLAQLRTLQDLGPGSTDPVTPLLAVLVFMAEALVGHVLVVLALRTLSLLPGSAGRLASRVALLLSPDVVRRLLDLLVGGTLLAQVTLTATPDVPPGRGPGGGHTVMAPSLGSARSIGSVDQTGPVPSDLPPRGLRRPVDGLPAARPPVAGTGPAEARPSSRRSAAPLPPWLGGGPSKPTTGHTVEPGDTLWEIAATRLARAERSPGNIQRHWRQIYRANRQVIGADPDLILPGTRLDVPPFRDGRR